MGPGNATTGQQYTETYARCGGCFGGWIVNSNASSGSHSWQRAATCKPPACSPQGRSVPSAALAVDRAPVNPINNDTAVVLSLLWLPAASRRCFSVSLLHLPFLSHPRASPLVARLYRWIVILTRDTHTHTHTHTHRRRKVFSLFLFDVSFLSLLFRFLTILFYSGRGWWFEIIETLGILFEILRLSSTRF